MTFFGKVAGIKNPVSLYDFRYGAAREVTALAVNAIAVNNISIGLNAAQYILGHSERAKQRGITRNYIGPEYMEGLLKARLETTPPARPGPGLIHGSDTTTEQHNEVNLAQASTTNQDAIKEKMEMPLDDHINYFSKINICQIIVRVFEGSAGMPTPYITAAQRQSTFTRKQRAQPLPVNDLPPDPVGDYVYCKFTQHGCPYVFLWRCSSCW